MDRAVAGDRLRSRRPTRLRRRARTPTGFNDGLLYYDEHYADRHVTDVFPTKRFFVLGQFSRYVRPGAVRHDVTGVPEGRPRDGVRATAEVGPSSLWNEAASAATVGIAFPAGTVPASATAVYTDAEHDLLPGPAPARTDTGTWIAKIAPRKRSRPTRSV